MVVENSSLKGVFGQNISYPPKWSLTDDSRFLQAVILKLHRTERGRNKDMRSGNRTQDLLHQGRALTDSAILVPAYSKAEK